jgi:A/G-specific adenine glycosylase
MSGIVSQLRETLLCWYDGRRRDLPWRGVGDPYAVWVAEVMLQQTRVETVRPYFLRWMEQFPTVADLAAAPSDAVLKAWEGLGYYARARNLQRAARLIMDEHDGRVPDTWDTFLALPGVGDYTAGAVLSIAFGQPHPAVDGNTRRVLVRLFAVDAPVGRAAVQRQIRDLAARVIPADRPGDFNQALMDLGAEVCLPRRPRCAECPVVRFCEARHEGREESLPPRDPPRKLPHHQVAAGIIWGRDGRLLLARRSWQGLLGGLWAFPAGRIRIGESPEACVHRMARSMLGVEVGVGALQITVEHGYTHFEMTLRAYACQYRGGSPEALGCAAWAWVTPHEASELPLSVADRKVLESVVSSVHR